MGGKWDDDLKRTRYYLRESDRIRKEQAEEIVELSQQLAVKDKEIERLKLIANYARHNDDCASLHPKRLKRPGSAWPIKHYSCNCSFQELLDAAEKGEK